MFDLGSVRRGSRDQWVLYLLTNFFNFRNDSPKETIGLISCFRLDNRYLKSK